VEQQDAVEGDLVAHPDKHGGQDGKAQTCQGETGPAVRRGDATGGWWQLWDIRGGTGGSVGGRVAAHGR